MKKQWEAKLKEIESKSFSLCAEEILEEWIKMNAQEPVDCFQMLSGVPEELRRAYLIRYFKKIGEWETEYCKQKEAKE